MRTWSRTECMAMLHRLFPNAHIKLLCRRGGGCQEKAAYWPLSTPQNDDLSGIYNELGKIIWIHLPLSIVNADKSGVLLLHHVTGRWVQAGVMPAPSGRWRRRTSPLPGNKYPFLYSSDPSLIHATDSHDRHPKSAASCVLCYLDAY